MEILDVTKVNSLMYHYENISKADDGAFASDLRELSASKMKQLLKTLEVEEGTEKRQTIIAVVQRIKEIKEEANSKKKQEEEKMAAKAKVEKKEVPVNAVCTEAAEIKINPEYQKMIPRPSAEQFKVIETSILKDGLKEKLRLLPDNTLYDGHTRHEILTKHGLPITKDMVEVVDIPEKDVPYEIYTLNIARRQLTSLEKISKIKQFLPQIKEEIKKEKEAKKEAKKETKGKKGGVKFAEPKSLKEKKKEAKKDRSVTRKKVAEKAGVSEADVKIHNWLEVWAWEMLAEGERKKLALGNIYKRAQEFFKLIKEHAPERLDEIKSKKTDIETVYNELIEKLPPKATAPKPGPMEQLVLKVREIYWGILKQKYGQDGFTPDEYELKFVNKLDVLISKYNDSEKK